MRDILKVGFARCREIGSSSDDGYGRAVKEREILHHVIRHVISYVLIGQNRSLLQLAIWTPTTP